MISNAKFEPGNRIYRTGKKKGTGAIYTTALNLRVPDRCSEVANYINRDNDEIVKCWTFTAHWTIDSLVQTDANKVCNRTVETPTTMFKNTLFIQLKLYKWQFIFC